MNYSMPMTKISKTDTPEARLGGPLLVKWVSGVDGGGPGGSVLQPLVEGASRGAGVPQEGVDVVPGPALDDFQLEGDLAGSEGVKQCGFHKHHSMRENDFVKSDVIRHAGNK